MRSARSIRPLAWPAGLLALLAACAAPPPASPRYHLGQPYQAGGVWHYPRESYDLNETGLGSVLPPGRPPLTANGERYDVGAMTAAHASLQLPAIARLTNLENGLATVVRINDRGTGNPHRLIEFSPRVAFLLRVQPGAAVRVRLTVLTAESQDAVAAMPSAPSLAIERAPRERIEVAELAPPSGMGAVAGVRRAATIGAEPNEPARAATVTPPVETLTQEPVYPGRLMVRLGTFEVYQYALIQRARVAGLRPDIVAFRQGRTRRWRVEMGPFGTVAQAEAAQDQALASGVPDARIVVD